MVKAFCRRKNNYPGFYNFLPLMFLIGASWTLFGVSLFSLLDNLNINIPRGDRELCVTPARAVPKETSVCEDTNFKVSSVPRGETKAESSYHCPNVCETAVDILYARICLRTSNLPDSYYLKIILKPINFSETSLDIRTSSFVYNYYLRKRLSKTFRAMVNIVCAAILCERISWHSKKVK